MANTGKFIDRSPIICAAGKSVEKSTPMREILTDYPMDDAIEAELHRAGLKKVDLEYKRQRMENVRHTGAYDSIKSVMYPKLETRYQTLLRDMKETYYDTYWKRDLGKSRDPVGGLPDWMNPDTHIFGVPTKADLVGVKELVNPPVTMLEIQLDTAAHHDMYSKTHHDFYPGEQMKYKYAPPFNENSRQGVRYNYDKRALCIQQCLKPVNSEPVAFATDTQANYLERTHHKIGKVLAPNKNIECVEKDYRFGQPSDRPLVGVAEMLMPEIEPTKFKHDLYFWLSTLHDQRKYCKAHCFDYSHLIAICRYRDKDLSGWIPFTEFRKLSAQVHLQLDEEIMISIAKYFGYYDEQGNLNYTNFVNLFNTNVPLPDLRIQPDVPSKIASGFERFLTTNVALSRFDPCTDNVFKPKAGYVQESKTMLTADYEDPYGGVDPLIRPSIYTNYGLSVWDFFQPREPEVVRKLFEKLGYDFPGDTFDKLWEMGKEIDQNGKVCIETFKNILYQAAPIIKKELVIPSCPVPVPTLKCEVDIKEKEDKEANQNINST